MRPADAAKLLELPDNATPDEIEARYNELRSKLEEKIGKAPTPGLKAKYRESLDEITVAFETLTLAADSSALPVLQKQSAKGKEPIGGPAPLRADPAGAAATPPRKKSGGMEFAIVAVIAVAVLGAGAWWVMKTRAEKAEQARIAAEAKVEADRKAAAEKAEADRKAEEARLAAEAKRKAEEEEKARIAAAERAEQERVNARMAELRAGLAELGLEWEAAERKLQDAQRRTGDLKSELRNVPASDAAARRRLTALIEVHEGHSQWLSEFLGAHAARRLQVRTEQFINSGRVDDAAREFAALAAAMKTLRDDLAEAAGGIEAPLYGQLDVRPDETVTSWTLVDAFGQRFEGTGPRLLERVAAGEAVITTRNGKWADQSIRVNVAARKQSDIGLRMAGGDLAITANVPNAEAWQGDRRLGRLPLRFTGLPPGTFNLEIRAEGYVSKNASTVLEPGQAAELAVHLEPRIPTEGELIDRFTREAAGVWIRRGQGLPGIGLLRLQAGSREVGSQGRYLGMKNFVNLRLTVPDPRDGRMHLVSSENPGDQGQELVLRLEDGQLVLSGPGSTQRFVRGSASDW